MKFKIGDKVKFLDENGGGIISKIISPKLVNVMIDDGFEIPVMASELLRIEVEAPLDSPKHFFREDFSASADFIPEQSQIEDDRNIRLQNNPAMGKVNSGIFMAYVPEDQKWLVTGLLDVYLVNHTPFDILYSVFLEKEDGFFEGFDYGSIEAESMVLLESLEREEIDKWGKGIVQVLFHTDKSNKVVNPGNTNFKIKLPRFYKETNYLESSIIDGKAILISLLPLLAQASYRSGDIKVKDDNTVTQPQKSQEVKPVHIIDKHKTSPREAVVDLHIEELVENHAGLDSSQILRLQINYFTQCLENAIANDLSKVTFIHGVGTGVLKTTIREILKDYEQAKLQDASKQQFGYGALDVLLR